MNHQEKQARINKICYDGRDHFMYFDVLFHRKKKLLIGASFDTIYYYEFFVLFTGVLKAADAPSLKEGEYTFRSLGLETLAETNGIYQTRLQTGRSSDPIIHHKKLFFYAPEKPLYTGMGIKEQDRANYTMLDFTLIVNKCFALEDTFPK
jgi:hypothetical protein